MSDEQPKDDEVIDEPTTNSTEIIDPEDPDAPVDPENPDDPVPEPEPVPEPVPEPEPEEPEEPNWATEGLEDFNMFE